jgi:predicted GH43/DUF377 family glycosyl hydrolase
MRIPVVRKPLKIYPDMKRVIARFFFNGDERGKNVIQCVMTMKEDEVEKELAGILREFARRHRNIAQLYERHCERVKGLFESLGIEMNKLGQARKLLIGSYFTHEYSIESAAFFNPSIIADPDQTDLREGELRVILSFRAVGEGHISSITFRRAVLDTNNDIELINRGLLIGEADTIRPTIYKKEIFQLKDTVGGKEDYVAEKLQGRLPERFDYSKLKKIIAKLQEEETEIDTDTKAAYEQMLWRADSYHSFHFSPDTDIADRVIFPTSEYEVKGVEDARFVEFKDKGKRTYYATYTAYDGHNIMPKLLETTNFYDFKIMPLYGNGARNKNLALFPRKINGKYAMLSRVDGVNNYIMYSDKINVWNDPQLLQEPKYPWEFTQIGNCGSPIETDRGWLLITHGVGPMRRYCLGASLFKLDNPSYEIGRLREPLMMVRDDEREGYVPNVLYTCGSIIHNNELIIPYGISDWGAGFATVALEPLLDKIVAGG